MQHICSSEKDASGFAKIQDVSEVAKIQDVSETAKIVDVNGFTKARCKRIRKKNRMTVNLRMFVIRLDIISF